VERCTGGMHMVETFRETVSIDRISVFQADDVNTFLYTLGLHCTLEHRIFKGCGFE